MFSFFRKKPAVDDSLASTPTGNESSELNEKISSLQRCAWMPNTRDGDLGRVRSKFSGIPYITADNPWPICPNCGNAMQSFLQLNLSELPEIPEGCPKQGLIQLFYCTNSDPICEVDCEAFFPGSESVVARFIGSTENDPKELQDSPVDGAFQPKTITDWIKKVDYPNWEEMEEYGVELAQSEERAYESYDTPLPGDKLFGWPAWVQGLEYPNCAACNKRMKLLFQIDSEDHLPYMFGDVGCGHLCQCVDHPEQLAFGWACC